MSEHTLCNGIIKYLAFHGYKLWRTNAGMVPATYKGKKRMIRLGNKGTSDIIGVSPKGRFVALEVKLPEKEDNVTGFQTAFLESIREHGGIAGVVTSPEEALALVESFT